MGSDATRTAKSLLELNRPHLNWGGGVKGERALGDWTLGPMGLERPLTLSILLPSGWQRELCTHFPILLEGRHGFLKLLSVQFRTQMTLFLLSMHHS